MGKSSTITIEQARVDLSDLSRRIWIAKERFIVTFHGKPMFAMVPLDEIEGVGVRPKARARTRVK